jgi:2-polyprenyl-3-methyl-5-hydroxy-6-metoxy-1,4-benzoquinol methylase
MPSLTGRRLSPEHMDDPGISRDELSRYLYWLRLINRFGGGTAALIRELDRWSRDWPSDRTLRLLDVGTGAADIPLAVARWARSVDRPVRITAVDNHPTTLELARAAVADEPAIDLRQVDARELTDHFQPGAFDVAHAALFLHHLPDIEVMTVMRMMDRLTTIGVVISDLVRSPITAIGTRLVTAIADPKLRHDAIVSVQAGFTRGEAIDLARRVGLEQTRYRRELLYRFVLTSEKQA